MRTGFLFLAPCLASSLLAAEVDGVSVVQKMHGAWAGKWYRTLSFAQHTRTLAPDGSEVKGVWYEALEHPGKLRIDYAPLRDKAGIICAQDRIFQFKAGVQVSEQATWNHLLVLIGDVYCQDVNRSAFQLEKLGFDLKVAHQGEWKGRPCWVVGARAGDLQANQFWVDARTYLLQRVIRRDPATPKAPLREVQILDYRQVQGYPIASLIHFFFDGRLAFTEDYFDTRVNVPLDPVLFEPTRFGATQVPSAAGK